MRGFVLTAWLAIVTVSATPVFAQFPGRPPYPSIDMPMVIAPGHTVRVLNIIVLDLHPELQPSGKRFDVQYASRIASSDTLGRHAEADLAAAFFGSQALQAGARRLSVALCDNRACEEMREAPKVWYAYEYVADVWKRSPTK